MKSVPIPLIFTFTFYHKGLVIIYREGGAGAILKTDLRLMSSGLVSNWSKIFTNTSEHMKKQQGTEL